jgi:hypothetical protein
MDKVDIHIEWQEGNGESVEIGYLNPNGQQCCGHCGVPGTDHGQYAYKTECTYCGYVYGTNGTDMHERRDDLGTGQRFGHANDLARFGDGPR